MRFFFALASLFLGSVNLCLAAEAGPDFVGNGFQWYMSLFNMGASGVFIAYMIWDKHVERTRKDKENERWYKMETVLLDLVASTTKVNMETTLAVKELRTAVENLSAEVQRLVTILSTGSDHRRRASDRED